MKTYLNLLVCLRLVHLDRDTVHTYGVRCVCGPSIEEDLRAYVGRQSFYV